MWHYFERFNQSTFQVLLTYVYVFVFPVKCLHYDISSLEAVDTHKGGKSENRSNNPHDWQ